jgi:hypothetical protein
MKKAIDGMPKSIMELNVLAWLRSGIGMEI